jgi:osmoprotectant transport system permease protein
MSRLLLAAPLVALAAVLLALAPGCARRQASGEAPLVRVGSKMFTESAILGEVIGYLARDAGAEVEHKARLGDTLVAWTKLGVGDIDVYCEYTGTLTQEVLKGVNGEKAVEAALAERGLKISRSLGFNNTYALGMKRTRAEALNVRTISDLKRHPELKPGLSGPFLLREDGWPNLRLRYGLPQPTPNGKEHDLLYREIDTGNVDFIDLYSTDAKIRLYDLVALEDDKKYFPDYQAILLYRADLEERAPAVVRSLLRLEGAIDEATMIGMNAEVELARVSETRVAGNFVRDKLGRAVVVTEDDLFHRLLKRTGEHLMLVAISLALAIVASVPLGILAAKRAALGQAILAAAGIVQTIPSLALLVLLILIIRGAADWVPAVVALFLYSLLPIVRNTYAGLTDVPLTVRESAEALGLSPWARLYLVELPLASRSILAGIKTAAVINVGTATLGGLIGAGGYGQTIFAGINKSDKDLILEGAIPAVLLALAVQGLFELAERFLVPRGLRLKAAE